MSISPTGFRAATALSVMAFLLPAAGLAGSLAPAPNPAAQAPALIEPEIPAPIDISADGELLLLALPGPRGFELANTRTGQREIVSSTPNTGYFATLSPDKHFVCYKDFQDVHGRRLQIPTLYDIATKQQVPLSAPVPAGGNPVISSLGQIACTIGEHLLVWNPDRSLARDMDLGAVINVLSFSPDGRRLAFGEPNGTISWIDLKHGTRVRLPASSIHGYQAHFSPDGQSLLARDSRGEFSVCHLATGAARNLGPAAQAAWADNDTVALVRKTFLRQANTQTRLLAARVSDGSTSQLLTQEGSAEYVIKPSAMAVITRDEIALGSPLAGDLKKSVLKPRAAAKASILPMPAQAPESEDPQFATTNSSTVQLVGVPYVHQLYDTPDNFSAIGGGDCCNATATLMAIQYYGRLPVSPVTVSGNGTHVSYYGNYIPNSFSYNGYTYNVPSSTAWGSSLAGWYGGFGYFLQDDTSDSLTHSTRLSQWVADSKLTSGTDDSVGDITGFTKAQAEINANHPVVILNSLTSAGHYITCIGYVNNQYTLIFNDPYGNKNVAYPSAQGAGAWYDWPGYNNGYQNLNTSWRFVYARGSGGQPGVYWDPYGTSTTSSTPSGPWDSTTTIWSCVANGTAATGPWSGPVAIFSAGTCATGSYTITVSGTQTVNHLLVQTGNVTFTGGQINFSGSGAYFSNYVASGCSATYNTPFGGSASPDKWGPGTASYNGASTSGGYFTLNQGTLALGNNAALGAVPLYVGDSAGANVVTLQSANANAYTLPNCLFFRAHSTIIGSGGNLTFSGPVGLAASSSSATSITVSNSLTTFSGVITNTGGLTKLGPGTLVLSGSGPNTYGSASANGHTTVNAGTLKLSKTAGVAAVPNGSVFIYTGGTVLLGAANQIGDAVMMIFQGGAFQTGGFNEQLGSTQVAANSVVDLGNGGMLKFANSSALFWISGTTLTITNWSGCITGGGACQVSFGSDNTGLTSAQLGQILFTNPAAFPAGTYSAKILSTGEVVPATLSPKLLSQPRSQAAVAGENVTFSCTAAGVPVPAYQWFLGGGAISGATSTQLALTNVALSQAGAYCVTLTNLAGSQTSTNAVLSVYGTAAPTLSGASRLTNGQFQLNLTGVPGRAYSILVSTNLANWTTLQTSNSPFIFTDTSTSNAPYRFYRAQYAQ